MKNNKTIYKFLIVAVIISLFASCKQDVIFYDISQEVEYETPIVEGNIFSMVPCKGILFVQNNMIYQKGWLEEKSEEQKWEKIESPVADKAVTRLASDENYLYALVKESTSYIGDVYVTQVTSSGIGSWNKVASNVRELYDNRIFDKNNGTTVGRHAYFTDSINLVSRLDGTQGPQRVFVVDLFPPESLIPCIRAAGSDGTYDYFSSNSEFAVANVSGETYFYSSSDKTILVKSFTVLDAYSWDSITGASFSPSQNGGTMDSKITTLTTDIYNGKLLVGTQNGYEISTIGSNGVPSNGEDPTENAESAFGTRYISGIWHYGAANTLYAAVVGVEHSEYNKLWGFYSSRNKWNYE